MMKKMKICALCAVLAGSLFAERVTTVVPAGETFTLNLLDTAVNVETNVFNLGAGATLDVTVPTNDCGFAMYAMSLGAPTTNAANWAAALVDVDANFVWDTFCGTRTNLSWTEQYASSSTGYAVLYQGRWNVPQAGNYGFLVNIDDWGYLEIDGQKILASDKACVAVATNNVALAAGWHNVRIVLGNISGNFGAAKGVVPGIAYSSSNTLLTTNTVATAGERFVDPGDGSVLRPTRLAGGSISTPPLYACILGTNGAITVDATSCAASSLRLRGGLRTRSQTLNVVGVKQIVCGTVNPTAWNIGYPLLDVGAATFADDDATGFRLVNQVTLARLPADVPCSIAPETTVAVRGTDTLARFYDDQGALNLVDWNLYVLENTAVPATTPIRVGAGRSIRFKLCEESGEWDWFGLQNAVMTNRIELLDPTASCYLTSLYTNNLYGTISGTGDLWQDGGSTWTESRAMIFAACSQTGTVHVTENSTLVFCDQSTPGYASNTVDIAAGGTFSIHPTGYGTVSTTAYVARVTGSDAVTSHYRNLHVGVLETFEIGRIEAHAHAKFHGANTGRFIIDEVGEDVGLIAKGGLKITVLKTPADDSAAIRAVKDVPNGTVEFELGTGTSFYQATVEETMTLVLSGTGTVDRIQGAGTVRLAEGAEIRVREISSETRLETSAGRLVVLPPATDWRTKVLLWLDATETNSLRCLTNSSGAEQVYTNGYKLIDAWFDRRSTQRTWAMYNRRKWELGYYDLQPQVYPFRVTQGGPNGLPYLSFGTYQQKVNGVGPTGNNTTEARRLQVWKGELQNSTDKTSAGDYSSFAPAWVVMAFRPLHGGGQAVLGTASAAYGRASASLAAPIAKRDFELYLDGVAASPTNSYFNGGWQLLSFAGASDVNALNWMDKYQNAGGQAYGEVIFFSTKPTDAERRACERYLAVKWGMAESVYPGEGCALRLQGPGEVSVASDADAVLDGAFSGTLTLAGGCLTVADGKSPLSEADIPVDGRVAWFDPNATGALGMSTLAASPLAVRVLHSRNNAGVVTTTGAYYLLGTCTGGYDRRPWLNAGSRGGAATQWLDFSNKYTGDDKGNTLRIFQEPAPTAESSDTAAKSVNVRTAFVALDSSKGGGMPLIDTVAANSKIQARTPTTNSATPIWSSATVAAVTGGETRLDGEQVAGTTTGYNGRPEVLSLVTTADVPLSYFGWYGGDKSTTPNAEILGEILLFNTVLADDVRADIEAYLMKKWAGTLPDGYADLRDATVAGSGTVRAKRAEALPQFADDFTGTVALAQTAFAFTLDTRAVPAVADALVLPCALQLPEACTVSVTCAAKPKAGRYPLITAQAIAGVESWTLAVSGETGKAKMNLVCQNGVLSLEVVASGTMVLVR